eukprot:TRINITY_DN3131_c2_g1_i1.p1 TRINITY_DN3131_c2_g1~~TRINITY_DN3131_c2_g1_i1.p1  ORF type:complete len:741 (-),score=61.76 TRINITY_DN3131_c2_g1_i1:92-2314(-)
MSTRFWKKEAASCSYEYSAKCWRTDRVGQSFNSLSLNCRIYFSHIALSIFFSLTYMQIYKGTSGFLCSGTSGKLSSSIIKIEMYRLCKNISGVTSSDTLLPSTICWMSLRISPQKLFLRMLLWRRGRCLEILDHLFLQEEWCAMSKSSSASLRQTLLISGLIQFFHLALHFLDVNLTSGNFWHMDLEMSPQLLPLYLFTRLVRQSSKDLLHCIRLGFGEVSTCSILKTCPLLELLSESIKKIQAFFLSYDNTTHSCIYTGTIKYGILSACCIYKGTCYIMPSYSELYEIFHQANIHAHIFTLCMVSALKINKTQFMASKLNATFITGNNLHVHARKFSKSFDRSRIEQLHDEISRTVDRYDGKVTSMLAKQENEYLAAFKCYVASKEEEVKRLEDAMRESTEQRETEPGDIRLIVIKEKLKEKEVETNFLMRQFAETRKELLMWKAKALRSREDCEFLEKTLKEKVKENGLLKCFLKQTEEMLSQNKSLDNVLETMSKINKAANVTEPLMEVLKEGNWLKEKEKPKNKRTQSMANSPPKRDDNKETDRESQELRKVILQLQNQLERKFREIKSLKQQLAQFRSRDSSLATLFENCVEEIRKKRSAPENKTISEKDISKIHLLSKASKISDLSSKEKKQLVQLFLYNDAVMAKLVELMFSHTKNLELGNISFEPQISAECYEVLSKNTYQTVANSSRNYSGMFPSQVRSKRLSRLIIHKRAAGKLSNLLTLRKDKQAFIYL